MSASVQPTLSEFWRSCHEQQDQEWLTGSALDNYLDLYDLPRPVGLDVTEIGVGLGTATRALALKNRVTAVDIVPEALVDLPCPGLLVDLLDLAPPADLAICHLVFQHCTPHEVARLMRVPLKRDGVFAFQFAWVGNWVKNRMTSRDLSEGRLVWHTPDDIYSVMHSTGLAPVWYRGQKHNYRGDAIHWGLMKARRAY